MALSSVAALGAAAAIEQYRIIHPDTPASLTAVEALEADVRNLLHFEWTPEAPQILRINPLASLRLQRRVHRWVHHERSRRRSPEALLVELKQVLRSIDDVVPGELRALISSEVVRWAIAAFYYDEPAPLDSPPSVDPKTALQSE